MDEACPLAEVGDSQPLPGATEDSVVDIGLSNEGRRQRRHSKRKVDLIPNSVYLVADKYNISNRALMELIAAFNEGDIKDYNISRMTIQRRRAEVRLQSAHAIKVKQLGSVSEKFYTLHWDAKKIKSMQHTIEDQERIAVLLTGFAANLLYKPYLNLPIL